MPQAILVKSVIISIILPYVHNICHSLGDQWVSFISLFRLYGQTTVIPSHLITVPCCIKWLILRINRICCIPFSWLQFPYRNIALQSFKTFWTCHDNFSHSTKGYVKLFIPLEELVFSYYLSNRSLLIIFTEKIFIRTLPSTVRHDVYFTSFAFAFAMSILFSKVWQPPSDQLIKSSKPEYRALVQSDQFFSLVMLELIYEFFRTQLSI